MQSYLGKELCLKGLLWEKLDEHTNFVLFTGTFEKLGSNFTRILIRTWSGSESSFFKCCIRIRIRIRIQSMRIRNTGGYYFLQYTEIVKIKYAGFLALVNTLNTHNCHCEEQGENIVIDGKTTCNLQACWDPFLERVVRLSPLQTSSTQNIIINKQALSYSRYRYRFIMIFHTVR
jgi:hypothetical protein